jgi:hypothetical protein
VPGHRAQPLVHHAREAVHPVPQPFRHVRALLPLAEAPLQLGRKAEDFRIAWKQQAPEATFGGKTLADLEADIAALDDAIEEFDIG